MKLYISAMLWCATFDVFCLFSHHLTISCCLWFQASQPCFSNCCGACCHGYSQQLSAPKSFAYGAHIGYGNYQQQWQQLPPYSGAVYWCILAASTSGAASANTSWVKLCWRPVVCWHGPLLDSSHGLNLSLRLLLQDSFLASKYALVTYAKALCVSDWNLKRVT
jgi:hypothetical protein